MKTSWHKSDLASVVSTLESGSRPKGGASTETGEVASLGGENIVQSGGVTLAEVKRVPQPFFKRMTKGHLLDGDVLINKDGAQTGKVGIYLGDGRGPACINEHVFLIRGNKEKICQEFLYYTLLSEHGQRQIAAQISGSAQPGLKSSFLKGVITDIPDSFPEQTKIAEVLSTVDQAIEQTEALIAKQQRIKKGLMQDLLTRGIDEHGNLRSEQTHEFKDSPMGRIPVEWVVAPLSHICEMITDGVHYAVRKTEAGIPFLFVSCIRDGEIQFDKASFIDRSTYEVISKGCEPKPGLVLYTVVGSYGNAAEVTSDKELGFERNLACITPNRDVLYPGYLVAWLNSDSGRNTADKYALGNAQKLISLSQLGSFCIPLPLFEEQIRIANKKDEVTQAVQSHKRTLLKLHKIKTALMQDLLTGKKRVTALLHDTEVAIL